MADFVRNTLLSLKFDESQREIDFQLDIRYLGKLGISLGSPMFWLQLQVLMIIQALVNLVLGTIIYFLIVKKRGSVASYLLGYGFLVPFLVVFPFLVISWADLRNPGFLLASAAGPCLVLLRCIEAMHGTSPPFAEKSLSMFLLYYVSTVQFEINPKTQEAVVVTLQTIVRKASTFLSLYIQLGIIFSVAIPRNFELFPTREIESPWDLFFWGNLGNNYIMAYLTSIGLEVGSTGIGLLTSVCSGYDTVQLNFRPLSESSSPSDFWGQRWNRLVSSGLKRAVFKPMRKNGCGRPLAALATFIASGILHEYLLIILLSRSIMKTGILTLNGAHLGFFAWNGVVLMLEPFVARTKGVQALSRSLPIRLKSFLVVMTVLPLGHLFTKEYVENGFFDGFSLGFPRFFLAADEN